MFSRDCLEISIWFGYYAARAAYCLSEKMDVEMPICREAYRVLYEMEDPLTAMKTLMTRGRKSESYTGEEAWVSG